MTSAATRLFALLGDPVSHSQSPRMQNAAFRAAGIDAVYVAIRCGPGDLAGLLRGIARGGGGGNVTVPHKAAAALVLDAATAAVTATGACNTFWLEDGRVRGDNTDVGGFASAALEVVSSLAGTDALVLGAGGGAAAAVRALLDGGAARVTLRARNRERALALAARQDRAAGTVRVIDPGASVRRERFDLVINATPLGLRDSDPAPLALDQVTDGCAIFDMVYRPGRTPWVRLALARGLRACDGRMMLVGQGAAAFRDWFGVEPPIGPMQAALAET